MKFCKDCYYGGITASIPNNSPSSCLCFSPNNKYVENTIDLVKGLPIKLFQNCYEARSDEYSDSCGTEARWFRGWSDRPSSLAGNNSSNSKEETKKLNKITIEDL